MQTVAEKFVAARMTESDAADFFLKQYENDEDIANALTFVYNSFGNSGLEVKPEEVKALRAEPPDPEGPKAIPQKSLFE